MLVRKYNLDGTKTEDDNTTLIQLDKVYELTSNSEVPIPIIPDPPYEAMRQVSLRVNIPGSGSLVEGRFGVNDVEFIGRFEFDEHDNLVELEDGEVANRAYNAYEFNIDRYNYNKRLEDPSHVDAYGFSKVVFLLRDIGGSFINDNIQFNRPLLGEAKTRVDLSDFDKDHNVLATDSPWYTYLIGRNAKETIGNSSVTIDSVNTPNIIDKDLTYNGYNPSSISDDSYYPQTYKVENGKVVRRMDGIYGYDLDLDILCLNSFTDNITSSPYIFSITDYNSTNSANYIGVRNLVLTPITTSMNVTYNANGTYRVSKSMNTVGLSYVDINVNVSGGANLENKTVAYSSNGTYTITPSNGYDGMSSVQVTVNVPSGGSNLISVGYLSLQYPISSNTSYASLASTVFTLTTNTAYVQVQEDRSMVEVVDNNTYWSIRFSGVPLGSSAYTFTVSDNTYYKVLNYGPGNYAYILDTSMNSITSMAMIAWSSYKRTSWINLNKSHYSLIQLVIHT